MISQVIKKGVMDFFSYSRLFLQSIYSYKPKTVFKSNCLKNLYFLTLLLSTIINIIKTTVGFPYITLVLGSFSAPMLARKMDCGRHKIFNRFCKLLDFEGKFSTKYCKTVTIVSANTKKKVRCLRKSNTTFFCNHAIFCCLACIA